MPSVVRVRWRKIFRELWGNKARTLLVTLSIAVGVFAVGTIANSWVVLLDDLNRAYLATNPASAVLRVEAFDADLVQAVVGQRSIARAEGRRSVVVKLRQPDGELFNLNLDAVDSFDDLAISQFTPETGVWPPARRELLLERSYAEQLGFALGDTVRIEMPDGQQYDLKYVGTVHDLHVPSAGNSEIGYGYLTLDTLQWLGESPTYNKLYLTVAENIQDEDHIRQVVTDIKEQVIEPGGYTVFATTIPTPGEAFLTVIIKAVLLVLVVVGAFSLLLSGALVVNTVSAIITRQTRQIGVMKAIGGRKSQITEIYLAAVAIYGLLSLLVAVPLAVVGSKAFTGFFAGIGNFDILTTELPPGVLILEIAIGLIVPVLAALIPITFGTHITVREAINDYGLSGDATNTPLDKLVRGARGLPGSVALALRNTFRRKARLFLTLGTLTLAGAIFIAVLSVRNSLFQSFDEALAYYQYDLSIDLDQAYQVYRLQRETDRIYGIAQAEGWLQTGVSRLRPDASESANYTMIGIPPASEFLSPALVAGRWITTDDRYKVVVNTDFVREEPDVWIGDTIRLKIGGEDAEWEVVGINTKQYSTPIVYVGLDDLGRATNQVGLANRMVLRLDDNSPTTEAAKAAAVEERYKRAGLLVTATTTRSDFVETFEFRFNFLVIFLVFLAFLLATVGGLGLAGTMSLNVLERVREIGVMRAIGASNGAVQRIIISEGVVIGVLSWIVAAVLAFPLSIGLSAGVGFAFAGEPLSFSFSVLGVGLWLALAVLIAILSSYLPARRASRLTVREILSYE